MEQLGVEQVTTPAGTELDIELWRRSPTQYEIYLGNTLLMIKNSESLAQDAFKDTVRWAAGLHMIYAD